MRTSCALALPVVASTAVGGSPCSASYLRRRRITIRVSARARAERMHASQGACALAQEHRGGRAVHAAHVLVQQHDVEALAALDHDVHQVVPILAHSNLYALLFKKALN